MAVALATASAIGMPWLSCCVSDFWKLPPAAAACSVGMPWATAALIWALAMLAMTVIGAAGLAMVCGRLATAVAVVAAAAAMMAAGVAAGISVVVAGGGVVRGAV